MRYRDPAQDEGTQRAISRSIEIAESRGQDFQMGHHAFRIVDGKGSQVYRRMQAPPSPRRDQQRVVSVVFVNSKE